MAFRFVVEKSYGKTFVSLVKKHLSPVTASIQPTMNSPNNQHSIASHETGDITAKDVRDACVSTKTQQSYRERVRELIRICIFVFEHNLHCFFVPLRHCDIIFVSLNFVFIDRSIKPMERIAYVPRS